jgi:parallel beta-helix repeat protein
MTVLDNTPRDQYTATGGQVAFSYTFEIAAEGDIAVLQNGVLLSLGTGAGEYAVTGVGSDTGGVVTLVTGATSGDIITLYRDMALERLTSYTNGGDFLAADVNNDYDRLWLALQQNTGTSNRALVAPNTDPTNINMTIPDKATRLGKYLKFNDTTGNPEAGDAAGLYTAAGMNHYNFTGDGATVNFTLGIEPGGENNTQVYIDGVYQQKDGYNVSGAVVQFSAAPPNLSTIEVMVIEVLPVGATTASQVSFTQAGSTYGRNVQLKLQESVSVKDFGAVGDGVTDDTAAIQAAIDAVSANGGGKVFLPEATYATTTAIKPKSNVHIVGEGASTKIVCSGFEAIKLSRDDATDNATPHVNVRLFNFYVESAWDGASPSTVHTCVILEFCNDCVIDSVYVGKADDAGIKVSGYKKGIASFTPSFTNPDFGFALRNRISNCTVKDSYHGIELAGGAQCDIVDNAIINSYQHGIRLAAGGWNCCVVGNKVMDCDHTALYLDYAQNVSVDNNPLLKSTRSSLATGISFGVVRDIVVSNNVVVGVATDTILTGPSETIIFNSNNVEGYLDFRETNNVQVFGNLVTQQIRVSGTSEGYAIDNIVGSLTTIAADMVQAGGKVMYKNNLLETSKLPASPEVQGSILGAASAIPTAGTFRAGDIIFTAAPSAGGTIGWVCTTAGTPGTWKTFGNITA